MTEARGATVVDEDPGRPLLRHAAGVSPFSESVYVDDLRVGDVIGWCGRQVTIASIRVAKYGWPKGRMQRQLYLRLVGDCPDADMHYYGDEVVTRTHSRSPEPGETT